MANANLKQPPRTQNSTVVTRVPIRDTQNKSAIIRQRKARLGEARDEEGGVGEDVVNPAPKMQRLARRALTSKPISKLKIFTKPVRRVWASGITVTVMGWYFFPYVLMIACGALYATGAIITNTTGSSITLIETMQYTAWGAGIIIGVISLCIATLQFILTPKVTINHSLVWVVLSVCLAGSLIPYTFFFPWVAILCGAVIISQK